MASSFTQVFGGTTIYPSDVSYLALTLDADVTLEWPLEAAEGSTVVARIIDITPSGPYTITLPDATSVSVGQTVLFNNLGPSTVTVNNLAGNAILSIGAGEQWQCYLISNTTVGGVWRTFRYGAAVAQAQAAALAGAGLTATGSTLAQNYDVTEFSITPYSLTAPDRAKVFVWTGGLGTMNLPTAVAAGDGWFVQVRNGGQGDLTIDRVSHRVKRDGREIHLGPTEFRLLDYFMQHPGRVFSREQLLDAVWGSDVYVEARTVDVHVGRLRKALNLDTEIDPIRTVRSAGYALDVDS